MTFNQARNEGINVLKGAVAFPVYYTLFCAYHRQTNEKISYDEYKLGRVNELIKRVYEVCHNSGVLLFDYQ